jgi:hypothetical protein
VRFNGWSKFFNLVSGSFGASTSTNTMSPALGTSHLAAPTGTTTVITTGHQGPSMGLAEQQFPLTVLQRLTVPGAGVPDAGMPTDAGDADAPGGQSVSFDTTAIQSVFYDNQCCAHHQEPCDPAGVPHCCPDFSCVLDDAGTPDSGVCQSTCVVDGGTCKQDAEVGCCGTLVCGSRGSCQPPPSCAAVGSNCTTSGQTCCAGLACSGEIVASFCCVLNGNSCSKTSDCCDGTCSGGVCL